MLLLTVINKIQEFCVHFFLINYLAKYFTQTFYIFKNIWFRISILIGNKIADNITADKPHHKIIRRKIKKEILRERFTPSELRHKIIDDLKLKEESYWWSKINVII